VKRAAEADRPEYFQHGTARRIHPGLRRPQETVIDVARVYVHSRERPTRVDACGESALTDPRARSGNIKRGESTPGIA
jgi:hypothetical protein